MNKLPATNRDFPDGAHIHVFISESNGHYKAFTLGTENLDEKSTTIIERAIGGGDTALEAAVNLFAIAGTKYEDTKGGE